MHTLWNGLGEMGDLFAALGLHVKRENLASLDGGASRSFLLMGSIHSKYCCPPEHHPSFPLCDVKLKETPVHL